MNVVLIAEIKTLTNKFPTLLKQTVEAGFNTVHDEASGSKVDLNAHLMPVPYNNYLMQVTGDSMIDKNIFSGDEIIIDTAKIPKNGNIVVATLNGSFTIKELVIKNKHFYLKAGNSAYKELIKADEANIWGVVTSIIRKI